jgi:hypothetical protein
MILLRNKPLDSFSCHKCAKDRANFFVANWSTGNPTDVIPLCFQCYARKRKMEVAYCKAEEVVATAIEEEGDSIVDRGLYSPMTLNYC